MKSLAMVYPMSTPSLRGTAPSTLVTTLHAPTRSLMLGAVAVFLLFIGCVDPKQKMNLLADRVDRVEQTTAGMSARVDKVEAQVAINSQVDVKAEVKTQVETALVRHETTKTETTSKKVINDVWPWLLTGLAGVLGVLIILGVVALIIIRWQIRKNSYLAQKPIWEQKNNYYVIDKTAGRSLTAVVLAEYSPGMARLIGTEQELPPVSQGDALVLKDWLIDRGFQWSRDFYVRRAEEQVDKKRRSVRVVEHDSKGVPMQGMDRR